MAKALNFVRKESSKNRYVWTRRIFWKRIKKVSVFKHIRILVDGAFTEAVLECKKHFNLNQIHKQEKGT